MSQVVKCEVCGNDMQVYAPPFPPQIQNGTIISTIAMVNGRAECGCGAKYVTHIAGVQVSLGFQQVKEESRIVVPTAIPPNLSRIK